MSRFLFKMSSKCLKSGSSKPEFNQGKLVFYNNRICPFSRRVKLILCAKNIPHETVNIHLKDKPEWFKELTPSSTVPIIEFPDGKIIYESLVVAEYLDDAYGELDCRLLSTNPMSKAFDKILIERLTDLTKPLATILYKFKSEDFLENLAKLQKSLTFFDDELANRHTKFFGGIKPMFVDYMIWPMFERFESVNAFLQTTESNLEIPDNLNSWMKAMHEDSAVKNASLSLEAYMEFIKSVQNGNFNYDVGLE